ncbi:hypothetical protein [Arthrobacter sp. efr-133-R2A-63]|uniref:hypothetical protein n=1 Tax=Arthrobacter sp. efr-133-R2A-63 TaxID=3040278 RepID=UPI00254D6644|nr:hypothetical protein [Arthrobacter sp. efr-133-R2A-63]
MGLGETRRDSPTVPTQSDKAQGKSMLAGLAPLSGVHSASSVAGCWVLAVRRRAPARQHLFVYDVFWLLSFGF